MRPRAKVTAANIAEKMAEVDQRFVHGVHIHSVRDGQRRCSTVMSAGRRRRSEEKEQQQPQGQDTPGSADSQTARRGGALRTF